jgi:hypothetical protein
MTWTKPYHGIQHYGNWTAQSFSATVSDYGRFAEAAIWTPGCRFSPATTLHVTVEEARKYAENQLHVLTQGRLGVRHDP